MIKPNDYIVMKEAIGSYIDMLNNSFPNAVENLIDSYRDSSMRELRFDLLRASKLRIGDGKRVMGDVNLYSYANDEVVDEALRSIMSELGLDAAS